MAKTAAKKKPVSAKKPAAGKPSELAVTLYNVRDFCKTEGDLVKTLELLKNIGYTTIQVSGVALEPEIIRKHMDEFGLYCCATHEGLDFLLGDPGRICDKLDILGCDFTALGGMPALYRCQTGAQELADKLNCQAAAMARRNKMLAYHNHHFEFDRKGGVQTLMQTLVENTDPDLVKFELDVQWVARGGANPAAWVRKLAGRIHVIHFKDFTMVNDTEPTLCEVGEGNLDWPDIVQACRETRVRFFSVEQDNPFPGRSIFDSMALSYRNLKALGLK